MEGVLSFGTLIGTGIELLKLESCGGGPTCEENTLEERGEFQVAVRRFLC